MNKGSIGIATSVLVVITGLLKLFLYLNQTPQMEFHTTEAGKYISSGNLWLHMGEYEKALEDYDQAIRLGPNEPVAYYDRALAYCALRQDQQALEDYDQAIRLNPNDADYYTHRGVVYDDLEQ